MNLDLDSFLLLGAVQVALGQSWPARLEPAVIQRARLRLPFPQQGTVVAVVSRDLAIAVGEPALDDHVLVAHLFRARILVGDLIQPGLLVGVGGFADLEAFQLADLDLFRVGRRRRRRRDLRCDALDGRRAAASGRDAALAAGAGRAAHALGRRCRYIDRIS